MIQIVSHHRGLQLFWKSITQAVLPEKDRQHPVTISMIAIILKKLHKSTGSDFWSSNIYSKIKTFITTSSAPPAIPTDMLLCPDRLLTVWLPRRRRKNLETATKKHEWTGRDAELPQRRITSHVAWFDSCKERWVLKCVKVIIYRLYNEVTITANILFGISVRSMSI